MPTYAQQRGLSRILGAAEPRRILSRRIQADRQGRQGDLDPRLLQPDPRRQRQAVQGCQVRHRRHRAEAASRRHRRPDRRHRQVAGGDRVQHGRHDHTAPTRISCDALGYSLAEIKGKHHGMFVDADGARQRRATASSGQRSIAANTRPANTSGSPRAAARSGFRRPTTRSSISTASRSRW